VGSHTGYININGNQQSLCCAEPCQQMIRVDLVVVAPTPTPVSSFLRPPGLASLGPAWALAAPPYRLQNPEAVEFVIVLELKTESPESP